MAVSQQLRGRAISDVYLTRWEIGDEPGVSSSSSTAAARS